MLRKKPNRLAPNVVLELRELWARWEDEQKHLARRDPDRKTVPDLARIYNISNNYAWRILRGATHADVGGPIIPSGSSTSNPDVSHRIKVRLLWEALDIAGERRTIAQLAEILDMRPSYIKRIIRPAEAKRARHWERNAAKDVVAELINSLKPCSQVGKA